MTYLVTRRPRVIMVELHGRLVGLLTVKDVLRFTMTDHSEDGWKSHFALDDLLEEVWKHAQSVADKLESIYRRIRRR